MNNMFNGMNLNILHSMVNDKEINKVITIVPLVSKVKTIVLLVIISPPKIVASDIQIQISLEVEMRTTDQTLDLSILMGLIFVE